MKNTISSFWNRLRNRPLVWDTITTTVWSSFGKGVGFLVPFFIAAWFGVSSETDAFFFTYGLILFLSGIFAPVIESLIVPYIAETISKKEDVGKFVGEILGISGVWLSIGAVVFVLVIKPILSLVTRFDADSLRLIHLLLIETVPLFVLLVWTSILTGALNAYKKFVIPATAPAIRAVVNLAFIFAFKDKMGVHAIAWGYVAGEIVRLVILYSAIKKMKLFVLSIHYIVDSKVKEFAQKMAYQTLGMVAVQFNPVVDKTMASWLGKGSVSVLEYAYRLYMIPVIFISAGVMVTLLSHWSSGFYESGIQRLRQNVSKAAKIVGFICFAITVLVIVFYSPIVKLAFGRGAFGAEKLSEVGLVFVCYMFGFLPQMLGMVYMRGHLTLKNTAVLMKYGIFSVFLNILLNYILMIHFKTAGIALSTSIAFLFYLFYIRRAFLKEVAQA